MAVAEIARYPERTKISHTHSKVISQTSASTCCDSFCCRCVNNAARNIPDTCCGHATDDAALFARGALVAIAFYEVQNNRRASLFRPPIPLAIKLTNVRRCHTGLD